MIIHSKITKTVFEKILQTLEMVSRWWWVATLKAISTSKGKKAEKQKKTKKDHYEGPFESEKKNKKWPKLDLTEKNIKETEIKQATRRILEKRSKCESQAIHHHTHTSKTNRSTRAKKLMMEQKLRRWICAQKVILWNAWNQNRKTAGFQTIWLSVWERKEKWSVNWKSKKRKIGSKQNLSKSKRCRVSRGWKSVFKVNIWI